MAEWKKVIVSGSTAALAAANVDGTVTANAFSGDGSNLTNVPAGSINIESFTNGTGITVASTDKLILSDAGTEKYINVSQLPFTTNSFRGIRVTNGETETSLESSEALNITAETNVSLSESEGVVTITSTDTNTTYSVGAGGLTQENFTTTLKNKLDGIAASANNYSLPEATATVRGGIELFSNTDQSVAANTVSATAGRTYGLQLNSAGQAVVNVPWTNTQSTRGVRTENGETGTALGTSETLTLKAGTNVSISESEGTVTFSSTDTNTTYSVGDGGLTQNNFTNADHSKLNGIAASANNYSLTIADVKSVLGGGMPSNALTIGDTNDTITIAGNLDVNGTTTTIDTTNLAVTDKFIELNRGATTEGDGGIVINGATNKSFGWDDTADRWAFDFTGATAGQTTIDTDAFVAAVAKVKTDVNYQKNGNLHVDGTDIWIYVE